MNNIDMKINRDFSWNWFWLGLLSIFVGIFLIGMPKYTDDYMFMYHLRPWFESQGILLPENGGNMFKAGIPYEEIWTTWQERYQIDNTRLGNMIVVFFLALPKWVGSGLMFLGFIWVVVSGLRMIEIDVRRSATIPLAVFLFGIVVPWRNHMGSMDYQFNYLGVSLMAFLFLWLLWRGGKGAAHMIVVSLTGLLTGGWQEAVSLPIFLGLLVMALVYKDCRRKDILLGLIGLLMGIVWIFSSPGQLGRASDNADTMTWKFELEHFMRAAMATYIFIIMLVVWLVTLWRSGRFKNMLLADKRMLFIVASGLPSVGLVLVTYTDARVGWWSTMAGIYGLLYILDKYYGNFWRKYNRNNMIIGGVLLVLVYAHWTVVDYCVIKMREVYTTGLARYVKNPDKVLYSRVIDKVEFPVITGNMPEVGLFTFGSYAAERYFENRGGRLISFIPEELRNVTSDTGELISGTAGMRRYKDRYFMPLHKDFDKKDIYIDYGNGLHWQRVWKREFTSERDGKDYVYVYLCENWYNYHFKNIKRIDIVDR